MLGATALILVTTLDDCVWLVPFLAAGHRRVVIEHALCFAATLLSLTTVVGYGTLLLQNSAKTWFSSNERVLSLVWSCLGALLCWVLAAYFFCKTMMKRRRRKQAQEAAIAARPTVLSTEVPLAVDETSALLGKPASQNPAGDDDHLQLEEERTTRMGLMTAQPWSVVTLTMTGFLDEVSYFPALILGRVFTVPEFIAATALTVVIMLLIVTQCLAKCRPLLDCLDHIPLYGIITLFAIILTVDAVLDFVSDE
jgi:hypothetical protein